MTDERNRDERIPRSVEIHHDHRDVQGGWLRPAVFGAMDGLVSNAALMAGVAGGSSGNTSAVALAGLAGLAAGAFSMAAGEYVSVRSQAELAAAEIEVERRELLARPEAEAAELVELYVGRGLPRPLAEQVVAELSKDPATALAIHTREEIGIDPHDLPSPFVAAGSSFLAFALGALIPLLPYLLGIDSLALSQALAVVSLFICGALVSRVTTRSWWFSGARQAAIGVAAGLVTYGLGSLVGTGLG
jgi:VIT1/CCC1 family predicted Fe2+/Mn2+ transporter